VVSRDKVLFVVVETSEEDWVMSVCELRDDDEVDEGIDAPSRSSGEELYVGIRDV
jgi:hypothetical protein